VHSLAEELQSLPVEAVPPAARDGALALERRELLQVRPELLFCLYVGVAALVGGVGWLIRNNLDRIGPVALLSGILVASALCYAIAWRASSAGRERSLGEDYVLLLGALLFSTAVGYAEARFRLFGAGWSRHLLLLALWHLAFAYLLRSRLVLSVALTAFATWLGVEASLGTAVEPRYRLLGVGPRALTCALLFAFGGWLHASESVDSGRGFRDVYRQFAVNFGFWGALALGASASTRWVGAVILIALTLLVVRAGLRERRQSFLLYAVGYGTVGLIWLESLLFGGYLVVSWLGLFTVIGAVLLLQKLRAQLRESQA
jgi:hypothetical protein